jgi:hypothetical protein
MFYFLNTVMYSCTMPKFYLFSLDFILYKVVLYGKSKNASCIYKVLVGSFDAVLSSKFWHVNNVEGYETDSWRVDLHDLESFNTQLISAVLIVHCTAEVMKSSWVVIDLHFLDVHSSGSKVFPRGSTCIYC